MSTGRGALIVFEGGDRCGKTTQTQLLVQSLQSMGLKAELWRFPDRTTPTGKMIDSYLSSRSEVDDAAIHLLFSANRWEKRAAMLRALREGTTLVVDRYSYSGVAFTASKGIPSLSISWCKAPEEGLPAPDLLLYLELGAEDAAARGGFGSERYETLDMQQAVRRQFESLRDGSWTVVDAARPRDAVHEEVKAHAVEAVRRCAEGLEPLRALWSREPLA